MGLSILFSLFISFGLAFIAWKVFSAEGKAKSTVDYSLNWFA